MKRKGKWLFFLIVVVVFTGMPGGVLSAGIDYPNKPINLYVGFGAGGVMSMLGRAIASKATEILGVPIIVLNKPGAGGTIAIDFVIKSKPDGYSIVSATTSGCLTNPILGKAPYKTQDLEYLGLYAVEDLILTVNSKSPWNTLEELIDYAKKHPEELKYASVGVGTSAHILMEMFNRSTGIKTVHVPMKSGPEVTAALLGEHIHLAMCYEGEIKPMKEGGKVRFLASPTEQRLKTFPELPTIVEKGYPDVLYLTWYGIAGPKGMPTEVLNKLKDALDKTFQDKEFQNMVEKLGSKPSYMPADQFKKFVFSEEEKLQKLFKEIGLKRE